MYKKQLHKARDFIRRNEISKFEEYLKERANEHAQFLEKTLSVFHKHAQEMVIIGCNYNIGELELEPPGHDEFSFREWDHMNDEDVHILLYNRMRYLFMTSILEAFACFDWPRLRKVELDKLFRNTYWALRDSMALKSTKKYTSWILLS